MKLKYKILFIVGVVLLVLGLIFGVVYLRSSNKKDFYSLTDAWFNPEVGSFTVVLDVQANEHTDVKAETVDLKELGGLASPEGDESDSGSKIVKDSDVEVDDGTPWKDAYGVKHSDWKYPKYRITIEGRVEQLEPEKRISARIDLATVDYNSVFTDVIIYDDKCYLDISKIKDWLENSGDEYLVSIGKDIPDGSTFIVIPESEVSWVSGLAEADEATASATKGVEETYKKFLVQETSFVQLTQKLLGDVGLSESKSDEGDVTYALNLSNENASVVGSWLKYIASSSNMQVECTKGYKDNFSEAFYQQSLRERDNAIESTRYEEQKIVRGLSSQDFNYALQGSASNYESGLGYDTSDIAISASYTLDNYDYALSCSLQKRVDSGTVEVPEGSQVADAAYSSSSYVQGLVSKLLEYFNFTDIVLDCKLDPSLENISSTVLSDFADLVNEKGCADHYLTKNNIESYIEEYANSEDKTEANAKLVNDFLTSFKTIGGTSVVPKESSKPIEVTKPIYNAIQGRFGDDSTLEGLYNVDSEKTTSNVLCVHALVLNTSEDVNTFDCTKFKLVDSDTNSFYLANVLTTLGSVMPGLEKDDLEGVVTLGGKQYTEVLLYFPRSSTVVGGSTLYYNSLVQGVLIK